MKAIIPLAGMGKRLRPHTHTRPKPLVHVAGKPLLGHILDQLSSYNIEEYVFIIGYLGEQIMEYVTDHYKVRAHFLEQTDLNGQAGAVSLARDYVRQDALIIFGDTLFSHHETGFDHLESIVEDGLIYVKEVDDPKRFGVIVTDGGGHVLSVVEKPAVPPSQLVNVGLYYLRDMGMLYIAIDLLKQKQQTGELYLLDAFSLLLQSGKQFTTRPIQSWLDCGTRESLLDTNKALLSTTAKVEGELRASVVIPPVYVEAGARIVNSVIGPYVSVGKDAEVVDSRVENSIINPGAKVRRSLLENSIIGNRASVTLGSCKLDVGDDCQIDF